MVDVDAEILQESRQEEEARLERQLDAGELAALGVVLGGNGPWSSGGEELRRLARTDVGLDVLVVGGDGEQGLLVEIPLVLEIQLIGLEGVEFGIAAAAGTRADVERVAGRQ